MKLYFIRHAQTQGNLERRYIGRTDEPLCSVGTEQAGCFAAPAVERVYTSPMLRCRQTAALLYPAHQLWGIDDFRECDFGAFENRCYEELKEEISYRTWVASCGRIPPPYGERSENFRERCCQAFERSVEHAFSDRVGAAALVLHGGTIMAVLERFAQPKRSFYGWQPPNMGGWIAHIDELEWHNCRTIHIIESLQGR